MATTTSGFVSVLNHLIEICKDGEEGYRDASNEAKDQSLKRLFTEYAEQRKAYAIELQTEVAKLGKHPEESGSVAGTLHRGWMNFKSKITGKNDKSIIDECEAGEDSAVKAYRDALSKDIPADLKSLVERQFTGIKGSHDRMSALKHATA